MGARHLLRATSLAGGRAVVQRIERLASVSVCRGFEPRQPPRGKIKLANLHVVEVVFGAVLANSAALVLKLVL